MKSFDFSNSHYFLFLLMLFNINLAFKGKNERRPFTIPSMTLISFTVGMNHSRGWLMMHKECQSKKKKKPTKWQRINTTLQPSCVQAWKDGDR